MSSTPDTAPTTIYGLVTKLLDHLPKWLKVILSILILALKGILAYRFVSSKPREENVVIPKPISFTLFGQLIGKTSHKALTNVTVSEEHNTLVKDESVDDGTYILEKITIPDSKIISLLVTYPDGTIESVKDIDVSQISPDKDGRIMIPNKEVKDFIQVKVNSEKTKQNKGGNPKNHFESNDNSQQINVPGNKGTIIIK